MSEYKNEIVLLGISVEEFPKPVKTHLNIWNIKYKDVKEGVRLRWNNDSVQMDVNPYKKRESDDQILIYQILLYIRGGTFYVEAVVDIESRTSKIRSGEASGKFK